MSMKHSNIDSERYQIEVVQNLFVEIKIYLKCYKVKLYFSVDFFVINTLDKPYVVAAC